MLPELGLVVSLILLILGSFGLPVGMPPAAEDPLFAKVAPAECVAYTTWAGTGKPDPASANGTEKVLADPEMARIKEFAQRVLATTAGESRPEAAAAMEKMTALAQKIAMKPGAAFVESIVMSPSGPPEVKAALVSRQDTEGPALVAQMKAWAEEHKHPLEQSTRATVAVTSMKVEGIVVHWCLVGNYFIFAQGNGTIEGIIARVRGTAAAPAFLTDLQAGAPAKRIVSRSYVNIASLKSAMASFIPPNSESLLATIGLDQLKAAYSVSALDDQGFVNHTWLTHAASPAGMLKGPVGAPLAAADFAAVPADATFALTMRGDATAALNAYMAFLALTEPQSKDFFERNLDGSKQMLGFDARKDLLGSLGNGWRIYSSPTDGPMVLPGLTLVIDAKDPAKLKEIITKVVTLMKLQAAQGAPVPPIEMSKVGEVDVFTLGGLPPGVPVTPSWAVVKDKLVVAATAITLKNFIKRDATFESLAKSPALAKSLGKAHVVAYVDMKTIVDTYGPLLPSLVQMAARQAPGGPKDFGKFPAVEKLAVHMQPTVIAFTGGDKVWEWTTRQTLPGGDLVQSVAMATPALVPAAIAAQKAAIRVRATNNLRQLGLGLLNYESTFRKFPPAYTVDKDGKPLHSWRTLILPYIEEQQLYNQLKLDEPWNSEHNLKLFKSRELAVYSPPGMNLKPGHTTYLTIRTKNGLMPAGGTGRGIRDIRDGTSQTIAVVEAAAERSVPWYQPDDFVPDAANATKGLMGARDGGFLAVWIDGHAMLIQPPTGNKVIEAMFTVDGGEVVDDAAINPQR